MNVPVFVARDLPWVRSDSGDVFVGATMEPPLVLSPPTVWVWECLRSPRSIGELQECLMRSLGEAAPRETGALRAQVDVLVALGLVLRSQEGPPSRTLGTVSRAAAGEG